MSRLQLFNFQALVLCFFVLEATSALAVEQDAYTKCTKQCGMDPGSIPIDMKDFDCVGECLGTIQKYCEGERHMTIDCKIVCPNHQHSQWWRNIRNLQLILHPSSHLKRLLKTSFIWTNLASNPDEIV
ncbi:hypothetical protein CRM22_000056 [Opisthorchis felineus]|uniref:Uncharacterized protein n=1 Tax=Opisthorchis felineus TaxID=147828 RepID=A0A4S2MLK9_OPIFE|nr:hypothetical protein CRM22_000056 [Opisthorchis felineus]